MGTNDTNSANKKMQMATNKNMNLFCHSLEIGNPVVVMAVALIFLLGMFVAPSNAFADTCYDDITGDMWVSDDCSTGPPVDAGIVNVTPTNDDADADTANDDNLANLIAQIDAVINTIVPFLVGLAVFLVIWGVFGYISHSAEEEKRAEARQFIIWGVIFIFCMLSIWGLVNILNNSFNLKKTPIDVPSVFPTTNN